MGLSTVPKVTGLKDGRPKYDVNPGIVVFLGLGLLKGVEVFGSVLGENHRGANFSDGFCTRGMRKNSKSILLKALTVFKVLLFLKKALIRMDFASS